MDYQSVASSIEQREAELIERFGIIEDVQERLQAISTRKPQLPAVPEEERTDDKLVRECSSQVWIDGEIVDGKVCLRMVSTNRLVHSLAGMVCDLCNGADLENIQNWKPYWVDGLRLERILSATRQRGLDGVLSRIRKIAENC